MSDVDTTPRQGFFFGWYLPIAALVLVLCYGLFLVYGFGVFLPEIIKETGWSKAQAAGVYGVLGAEVGLLAPIYGVIVDRFGSRKPMVIGSALSAVGLLLLSQVESLVSYYACFTLAGLGFGVYYFGPMAAIANWFKKNRALCMGIVLSGAGASSLLLPLLQSLVSDYGWRATMLGTGVATFLVCVPLSLLFRFRPEPYGYTVDGLPPSQDSNSDETDQTTSSNIRVSQHCFEIGYFGCWQPCTAY